MLLVVAATAFEAALVDGAPVRTLVCGIGPVEAALATSRAIADEAPTAILQLGIAGAQTLPNASIVLGSARRLLRRRRPGARIPRVERVPADPELLASARRALPDARVLPIGTTGRVGGGAVARSRRWRGSASCAPRRSPACPALELRVPSRTPSPNRTVASGASMRRSTRFASRCRALLEELLDA